MRLWVSQLLGPATLEGTGLPAFICMAGPGHAHPRPQPPRVWLFGWGAGYPRVRTQRQRGRQARPLWRPVLGRVLRSRCVFRWAQY